jgi:hypothetical protein
VKHRELLKSSHSHWFYGTVGAPVKIFKRNLILSHFCAAVAAQGLVVDTTGGNGGLVRGPACVAIKPIFFLANQALVMTLTSL